jgi:hypothetical protein
MRSKPDGPHLKVHIYRLAIENDITQGVLKGRV